MDRACQLVELLGAGDVLDGIIDVVGIHPQAVQLPLEPERINALLGTDIPQPFMEQTLASLGFGLEDGMITVPSWRGDCARCADIAEEIARFWGYDRIVPTQMKGDTAMGGYTPRQLFLRQLGETCRAMGFYEVMTYSFVSPSSWDRIGLAPDSPLRRAIGILNPLGEDTSVMRTTSLPSMLGVLATNLSHRNLAGRFYELATVYRESDGPLADERPGAHPGGLWGGRGFLPAERLPGGPAAGRPGKGRALPGGAGGPLLAPGAAARRCTPGRCVWVSWAKSIPGSAGNMAWTGTPCAPCWM